MWHNLFIAIIFPVVKIKSKLSLACNSCLTQDGLKIKIRIIIKVLEENPCELFLGWY